MQEEKIEEDKRKYISELRLAKYILDLNLINQHEYHILINNIKHKYLVEGV